jgi:flagellar hook-associated protein 2
MITQIQLGNIFSQNGRQVVGGGNTGLDVETLVNSLVEARRLPAVTLEENIEKNAKISTALSDMRAILNRFQDAANFLRNPPGVRNFSDNVFEYRSADVSSNSAVAGSNYLRVNAEPGAAITDYAVTVQQIATRNQYVTNTIAVADLNTAVVGVGAGFALQAGTLELGANSTDIVLNAGDTLAQVVTKINAAKGISGVEAETIKVADGQYRLSLKTTDTGAAENYSLAASPVFTTIGFATTQVAQDAIINLNGTDVQRSSNNFDDVLEGISFTALQATPAATTLNVSIEADTEVAKQGILNFVDAYNEFRLFASAQSQLGNDGRPLEDAILAGSPTLSLINSRIGNEISGVVSGILDAADPARLADLGIKFSDFPGDDENPFTRNILTVDEGVLETALQTNFDAVRKVFEFDFSSDNSDLQVFQRSNQLGINSFSLNINQTGGVYEATYLDASNNPVTIALDGTAAAGGSGVVLTGRADTPLEGLVLIYGNTNDATVNVNISQGIADRLYNNLDGIVKEDTGVLDTELQSLSDKDERSQTRIDLIDEQLARYRDQLLSQFSALERAINSANTILQILDAQANARSNS